MEIIFYFQKNHTLFQNLLVATLIYPNLHLRVTVLAVENQEVDSFAYTEAICELIISLDEIV